MDEQDEGRPLTYQEIRAFIDETHRDPYTAMLTKMWREAFMAGYEVALVEREETMLRRDIEQKALDHMTERKHRSQELIALAQLGTSLRPDQLRRASHGE